MRELLNVSIHAKNRLHYRAWSGTEHRHIVEGYDRISQPIAYFLLSPSILLYPTHIFTQAHELINNKMVEMTQANTHYWTCECVAPTVL